MALEVAAADGPGRFGTNHKSEAGARFHEPSVRHSHSSRARAICATRLPNRSTANFWRYSRERRVRGHVDPTEDCSELWMANLQRRVRSREFCRILTASGPGSFPVLLAAEQER